MGTADKSSTQELRGVVDGRSDADDEKKLESDLTGEYANLALLLLLYTLQGVPMGIAGIMPMILKEQHATFSDLSTFSLNSYPFVLKLLWAPIVDTVYISRIGRRKTWLVPAQLAIGVVMLLLSGQLDRLLFSGTPQIVELTVMFFLLYLLCATQDVAVDGWALTMLRPENRGYAATTNSVGQTLGSTLGYAGYVALEQMKLTTLESFLFYWGIVFIIVTMLVAVLKTEEPVAKDDEPPDVFTCYLEIISIMRLRAVRVLIVVLVTWKAPFALTEVAPLKMQEKGVSKETITWIMTAISPLYMLLPVVVAKWTSGPAPFDLALRAYPLRIVVVISMMLSVYATPYMLEAMPTALTAMLTVLTLFGACISQAMFVSTMALFANVSDPAVGGTYMTMLNTLSNLGGMWPSTAVMMMIDRTTCLEADCAIQMDGFYVMGALSVLFGIAWFIFGKPVASRLQRLHAHEWRVNRDTR